MKILFLTNIPSPYRVNIFNELGKKSDLTVLFEKSASDERDKSWKNYRFTNFHGIILRGISTSSDTAICTSVIGYIKKNRYDEIIVANPFTPTGMIAMQYMKFKKINYFIEGDGGFAKSGKGFTEYVKKYFIKSAKGYFSTSENHDKYYLTYGALENKIYRYPFTSLYDKNILKSLFTSTEKAILKQKLGLENKKTVITVGQFIYRKGFDVLLKAWNDLAYDANLIILGGGEKEEEYRDFIATHHLTNVTLLGFKAFDEVLEYFKACDLFVLPTREDIWGLVINEAMACGLPVITTDQCIAGLELIDNGENGYIVPVDNVEILREKIQYILENDTLASSMGKASLERIRPYTIENIASSHIAVLQQQYGDQL